MENDTGRAGLKCNQEFEGVFMGQGAQETRAPWDWGLQIPFNGVPGWYLACVGLWHGVAELIRNR